MTQRDRSHTPRRRRGGPCDGAAARAARALELRKLADTRAGMWLLIVCAAITLLVVVLVAIAAEPADVTFQDLLSASLLQAGVLLPVVAILGVTQEFSQRTALQTFTTVPRRGRVVAAKALAVLALGALTLASPALAIVVYFVLPTAFAVVGALIGGLDDLRPWIDTSEA